MRPLLHLPLKPGQARHTRLGGGVGGGLGQGLIRTSGTTDVALPCASLLVRRVLGCPVSRPAGLMTAPRTPRWHTREGDAAVPVCMGRARCLCVWGGSGWGHEARRVTRQRRAWPGPGPVCLAGGGSGLGADHCAGLWGGGGGSVLPLPALHWHSAGTSRYVGGRLLSCCSRRTPNTSTCAFLLDSPRVSYAPPAPPAAEAGASKAYSLGGGGGGQHQPLIGQKQLFFEVVQHPVSVQIVDRLELLLLDTRWVGQQTMVPVFPDQALPDTTPHHTTPHHTTPHHTTPHHTTPHHTTPHHTTPHHTTPHHTGSV